MGRETIVTILRGPKLGRCGMEKSDWCLLEIWRTGGGEGLSIMSRIEPLATELAVLSLEVGGW